MRRSATYYFTLPPSIGMKPIEALGNSSSSTKKLYGSHCWRKVLSFPSTIGRPRNLSAWNSYRLFHLRKDFRRVLNCLMKGNSSKESRFFIFHFFSKFLKRIIEVELKHFSSITRTKQSFLTICIRNKETEHKKKISTREKKKAQKLKLLKRFWDLR